MCIIIWAVLCVVSRLVFVVVVMGVHVDGVEVVEVVGRGGAALSSLMVAVMPCALSYTATRVVCSVHRLLFGISLRGVVDNMAVWLLWVLQPLVLGFNSP